MYSSWSLVSFLFAWDHHRLFPEHALVGQYHAEAAPDDDQVENVRTRQESWWMDETKKGIRLVIEEYSLLHGVTSRRSDASQVSRTFYEKK